MHVVTPAQRFVASLLIFFSSLVVVDDVTSADGGNWGERKGKVCHFVTVLSGLKSSPLSRCPLRIVDQSCANRLAVLFECETVALPQ